MTKNPRQRGKWWWSRWWGKEEYQIDEDKKRLNLEKSDEGVYIYKGRLQWFYPIYLPQDSVLSKKVIFVERKRSLHGGVAIAMSHVRSLFCHYHI